MTKYKVDIWDGASPGSEWIVYFPIASFTFLLMKFKTNAYYSSLIISTHSISIYEMSSNAKYKSIIS